MRKRTPSEIKAYGDGYAEAYKQFQHLIEKHEISTAVRKMKIFADAVALTVETATDTADTPQTEQKEYPVGCSGDWSVNCTSCDRYFSCDYLSGKQPKSTGSPIGDYRDGVGAWQTDCSWREPND